MFTDPYMYSILGLRAALYTLVHVVAHSLYNITLLITLYLIYNNPQLIKVAEEIYDPDGY